MPDKMELEKCKIGLEKLVPGSERYARVRDYEAPLERVTEETREHSLRDEVRVDMGMYRTTEEHEAWRRKVLAIPFS